MLFTFSLFSLVSTPICKEWDDHFIFLPFDRRRHLENGVAWPEFPIGSIVLLAMSFDAILIIISIIVITIFPFFFLFFFFLFFSSSFGFLLLLKIDAMVYCYSYRVSEADCSRHTNSSRLVSSLNVGRHAKHSCSACCSLIFMFSLGFPLFYSFSSIRKKGGTKWSGRLHRSTERESIYKHYGKAKLNVASFHFSIKKRASCWWIANLIRLAPQCNESQQGTERVPPFR